MNDESPHVYTSGTCVCASELLYLYSEASRRKIGNSSIGVHKGGECECRNREERHTHEGREEEKGKKSKTRADGEHKHTNKPAMRGKASSVHVQTTGAICRLVFFFVSVFIPPPPSLHPSPNRVSYPLCLSPPPFSLSLLSFCLPSPAPPRSRARSSSSRSSLQYTVPGGDSSKSNCLSISHQYSASRGSCPLKTMKVGLSAEPWMGFNYINEPFSI